jgi:hypothetical protein
VNTRNWWGGKRVLVPPLWIDNVNWPEAKVAVALTRQVIKDAPPYDSAEQVNRQQEQLVYEYYGRPPQRRPTRTVHHVASVPGGRLP